MNKAASTTSFIALVSLTTVSAFADDEKSIHIPVEISGEVEIEATRLSSPDQKTSDINLGSIEIILDAHINKWTDTHIVFQYEEDEEQGVVVDEGVIILSGQQWPLALVIGKQVLPFADFDSHLISDPMTLDIAETKDTALTLSGEYSGFYFSTYLFNGDINKTDSNDEIKQFGATVAYEVESDNLELTLGIDYSSSLSESDELVAYFEDNSIDSLRNDVAAIALYSSIIAGPWHAIASYVTALDRYQLNEVEFNGKGAKPSTYAAELAYTLDISSNELTLAISLQESDESLALELPKQRVSVSASSTMHNNISLGIEYLRATDYDTKNGGSQDSEDLTTLQLSVNF